MADDWGMGPVAVAAQALHRENCPEEWDECRRADVWRHRTDAEVALEALEAAGYHVLLIP